MHRKVSKKIKQCKNISERVVAICNIACYIYSNGQGVPDFEEYHFYGGLLLTKKLPNQGFLVMKVKSPFGSLYGSSP